MVHSVEGSRQVCVDKVQLLTVNKSFGDALGKKSQFCDGSSGFNEAMWFVSTYAVRLLYII